MKKNEDLVCEICADLQGKLRNEEIEMVKNALYINLRGLKIESEEEKSIAVYSEPDRAYQMFFVSKKIEGLSDKSLAYYKLEIDQLLAFLSKNLQDITSDDIRYYLATCQIKNNISKATTDNKRRVFNSFFSWLADERYINWNPMRQIKKIKQDNLIKKPFSEEDIEKIRNACETKRELAVIDILSSTAMRIGELTTLDRSDINFDDKEIVVFGKGSKERVVYLNARAKLNLRLYLTERTDDNQALFVSESKPNKRLGQGGYRSLLAKVGERACVTNVHPHRFRRTAATQAINRGMPIEQVQKMLGHAKIDTTTHYALVNQNNLKNNHEKYL